MSFIDELSTRSEVIDAVSRDPTNLQFASDAFKDDYEIVLAAVTCKKDRFNAKYSADAFKVASPRLRANRTIATECVMNDKYHECIAYIDSSLLSDRDFILGVLPVRPYVFEHSMVPMTSDFVFDCVMAHPEVMEFLPDEYLHDKEFALRVISRGALVLHTLPDLLKDDRDVVLSQMRVEHGGACLTDASHRLRRDRNVLIEAARTSPGILEYIRLYMDYDDEEREKILSDDAIVSAAVAQRGQTLRYVSETFLRTNREIVMMALTAPHPALLSSVPALLVSDPCIQLCVSTPGRSPSTVDALLTVVDANVSDCSIERQDSRIYRYFSFRPFTAKTILPMLLVEGTYQTQATPDRLMALAQLVNNSSFEFMDSKITRRLTFDMIRNDHVVDNGVIDGIFGYLDSNLEDEHNENKWAIHGVYDNVSERLLRLQQIATALPYIARAVRRVAPDERTCGEWVRRVDELAAKVHHPTGSYSKLVHKRSFEEAFA